MEKEPVCVTDRRLPSSRREALTALGFRVVGLPPLPSLPAPTASHTDLLLFYHGTTLLTREEYYPLCRDTVQLILERTGGSLLLSPEKAGDRYPADTGLCACPVGPLLLCRPASADRVLLELCARQGLRAVPVRQGYARCSCVPLPGQPALITADRGIAAAARTAGAGVLEITPGHVSLPGYDCGFIGGCAGLWEDTLFFTGALSDHPDAGAIVRFCAERGLRVRSLSEEPLYDVGGLFFF